MIELDQATQILQRVRVALETELTQARGQRLLVHDLDIQGLFERARQRGAFNLQLAQLESDLAQALKTAGQRLGLQQVELEGLRRAAPEECARLEQHLAEVQSLAGNLREVDAINRKLGERALGRIRRVLGTVAPQTAAYDRRGAHRPMEAMSTSRRVA